MTPERREEIKRKVEKALFNIAKTGSAYVVVEQFALDVWDEAVEEAAKQCRKKYPCGDPGHDDRWCARCSAIQDGADMLEDEILSLKAKGER